MSVLNFGSINIDHVYRVPHLVRPGETLSARSYTIKPGGKGANQSAAIALAGGSVFHAGKIGQDGRWMVDMLDEFGVDTRFVRVGETATGHAVIQVDDNGENSIVIYGGGNQEITSDEIDATLDSVDAGTVLLLQNEINDVPYIMRAAAERGIEICINPAPMTEAVRGYPLELVKTLMVNETEARGILGSDVPDEGLLDRLTEQVPGADLIITLGAAGLQARSGQQTVILPAFPAEVVDTTAAGDTFTGFYLARRLAGDDFERALKVASKASSITVAREGAMPSIPKLDEVMT